VEHRIGAPDIHIRAETPYCRRESAVLNGHVGEQVEEIPTLAGRRPDEVGYSYGVDDVDRLEHREPVQQTTFRRVVGVGV
jgi:hypothetical protein